MRKFLILVLTAIAAAGAHAGEPTAVDAEPQVALAPSSYADALVTIAPVPMPATVVELARYLPERTSLRQAKRVKAAKVARVKSMLSRSAREQIALARTGSAKPDGRISLSASENEEADRGIDALDWHRSFSQPKVAKGPDQADDDDDANDLSDHVKLRLLMARTKAVEAYILNQAGKAAEAADEELSDTVKVRLLMARVRAVKAHGEKFGDV